MVSSVFSVLAVSAFSAWFELAQEEMDPSEKLLAITKNLKVVNLCEFYDVYRWKFLGFGGLGEFG